MRHVRIPREVGAWRAAARELLAAEISPQQVVWDDTDQGSIFTAHEPPGQMHMRTHRVPRAFVELCDLAGCHREPQRWAILYRILWRLTHGEPHLLQIDIDPDVAQASAMANAVRRDRHKMTAFVRFRKVVSADGEFYIAWHRPDHFIVRLTAPFFVERFGSMRFSILTPDESMTWDRQTLTFGPGVPRREAPAGDELEELWKTYYASTFNPARLNLQTMRTEMPVRHWATMPETELLPGLIRQSNQRVQSMVDHPATRVATAMDFIPKRFTLPQLREAAAACRGCELHCNATQTVFGEGAENASLVFVGEQPGDQEDLSGRPFVGPAGQLFDQLLDEAGIDRRETYVTNVVKHFKWEPRGKRRMHSTPNARDVAACRPWLEAELQLIQPRVLVCLGSTAARALIGPAFSITRQRGLIVETKWSPCTLATYHPSAVLRIPDESAKREFRRSVAEDLRRVAQALGGQR